MITTANFYGIISDGASPIRAPPDASNNWVEKLSRWLWGEHTNIPKGLCNRKFSKLNSIFSLLACPHLNLCAVGKTVRTGSTFFCSQGEEGGEKIKYGIQWKKSL